MPAGPERNSAQGVAIRGQKSLVSGLALMAVSILALWLTSDLPQGTLRAMGPAMLPRWLAIGLGLCGLALVVAAFLRDGEGHEGLALRGPAVVVVAIMAFAAAVRGFSLGPLAVPSLGMAVAGPLAILIGGYATAEARLRELVVLALVLTAFCMILFGDLLNLPIPLFPQALADLYPDGWSTDARLRVTAGLLLVVGAAVFLAPRAPEPVVASGRRTETRRVDVAVDQRGGV
jgi:hypothetical protein